MLWCATRSLALVRDASAKGDRDSRWPDVAIFLSWSSLYRSLVNEALSPKFMIKQRCLCLASTRPIKVTSGMF